jgi:hypothetical protein
MPLSKRKLLKNSVSKDSQLSNGSKTENPPTTTEEELLTPSSHGSKRKLDHHLLSSLVMLLKKILPLINSLLPSLVPTPMMLSIKMLMLHLLSPMMISNLFTPLMMLVPLSLEPVNHLLFSSDNSRKNLSSTLEPLIKLPFLPSLSHL